jgi:hypothetical protein
VVGIAFLGLFVEPRVLAVPGVINVLDHGAAADGAALNTALQKAIAA